MTDILFEVVEVSFPLKFEHLYLSNPNLRNTRFHRNSNESPICDLLRNRIRYFPRTVHTSKDCKFFSSVHLQSLLFVFSPTNNYKFGCKIPSRLATARYPKAQDILPRLSRAYRYQIILVPNFLRFQFLSFLYLSMISIAKKRFLSMIFEKIEKIYSPSVCEFLAPKSRPNFLEIFLVKKCKD